MSDYIPFEIQAHILKMLPVKSLVLFRSVSKQWKSLIDSSKFISNHYAPHPEPQHLFVTYIDSEESKQKYVSFLDDNTFPKHKFYPTVPVSVNQFNNPKVIGISKGLVCLYSYTGKPSVSGTVVFWNPTIVKSVIINVPNVLYRPYKTVIGFAVCPRTNDPKLVKSTFIDSLSDFVSCRAWQVEVFSLSSNVWRTPSINLPDKSIALTGNQEVIDGVIYWLSIDGNIVEDCNFLIMSFDITTEEFTRIDLPGCISLDALVLGISLSISKLRDSLVVIEGAIHHWEIGFEVWIMEDGVPKTFTKIFNINPPHGSIEKVVGFLESAASIVSLHIDSDDSDSDYEEHKHGALFVYVPYSKHIDSIGISGNVYKFFVNSYTESLLLLDQ